jgi:chromosome segregation ATPase
MQSKYSLSLSPFALLTGRFHGKCTTTDFLHMSSRAASNYGVTDKPLSRIRDAQAALELIQEQLLTPSEETKELERYETEVEAELEEETHKCNSRWPELEECCMILKLELSRAQAELNAAYQRVEKQFAEMEPVKPDSTLVDAPCVTRPIHERGLKNKRRSHEAAKEIVDDLISFEDVVPKESAADNEIMEAKVRVLQQGTAREGD